MGCAKDIVEHCGVPRFVFSDFPLGNAAGKPHDIESQRQTLMLNLYPQMFARHYFSVFDKVVTRSLLDLS